MDADLMSRHLIELLPAVSPTIWYSYHESVFLWPGIIMTDQSKGSEKVRVSTSSIWSTVFILLLIKCQHHGQEETKQRRKPGSKCHFLHRPVFSTDNLSNCGDRVILTTEVTASVCLPERLVTAQKLFLRSDMYFACQPLFL